MTQLVDRSEATPGRLERRKALTRAAILAAAGRLFSERGFEATSIQQIAEAADTGVGTLYGYFASKDDILHEVLQAHSLEAVERYRATLRDDTPPIDRLCAGLTEYGRYIRDHRVILASGFAAPRPAALADETPAGWLFEAFRRVISDGIARADFRPVPVESTVRTLMGTYSMAMLGVGQWQGHADEPRTLEDLEAIVRALLAA